ncbi:hypothetical protein AB3X96_42080 [Paraburkholderia sp. BR13439]|uniref:Uncharacterized protein n=1 Tax=Paraburkholderia youngii TaxID=2782701 RepID=A0A7Y6K7Z3_9BURK|nr:hypothetical protein [Paraburkholderia youngii]NUY05564.1 hypothetical protein [Paraburkholderia youngii]
MRFQIDLFSGQPNPSWVLTECEVLELQRRLGGLHASAKNVLPDQLGYRGLLGTVEPASADARPPASADEVVAIELGCGVVRVTRRNGAVEFLADTGRSVELWLLTTAQGNVDEAIRKVAVADAGRVCS